MTIRNAARYLLAGLLFVGFAAQADEPPRPIEATTASGDKDYNRGTLSPKMR